MARRNGPGIVWVSANSRKTAPGATFYVPFADCPVGAAEAAAGARMPTTGNAATTPWP